MVTLATFEGTITSEQPKFFGSNSELVSDVEMKWILEVGEASYLYHIETFDRYEAVWPFLPKALIQAGHRA